MNLLNNDNALNNEFNADITGETVTASFILESDIDFMIEGVEDLDCTYSVFKKASRLMNDCWFMDRKAEAEIAMLNVNPKRSS